MTKKKTQTADKDEQVIDSVSQANEKVLSVNFLDEAARKDIIDKLTAWGISIDGLDDAQLIAKLTTYAANANAQLVNQGTDDLAAKLASYGQYGIIQNKEFLSRLYHLSVLPIWLVLFNDNDHVLPDEMIWDRIKKLGKSQIATKQEVMRPRYMMASKKNMPPVVSQVIQRP